MHNGSAMHAVQLKEHATGRHSVRKLSTVDRYQRPWCLELNASLAVAGLPVTSIAQANTKSSIFLGTSKIDGAPTWTKLLRAGSANSIA